MNKSILDSRNLIERAEELLTEFGVWKDQLTIDEFLEFMGIYGCEKSELTEENFLEQWRDSTSEGEEYKSILELEEEINSDEWKHGLTLIADSFFEQYAREYAEDIGAISGDERWPATCIDWERAASELQYDFSSVDFDGETYWYRD